MSSEPRTLADSSSSRESLQTVIRSMKQRSTRGCVLFVQRLRGPNAAPFKAKLNGFMSSLVSNNLTGKKAAQSIQEFINLPTTIDPEQPCWAGLDNEKVELAREALEKCILIKLYKNLFTSTSEERFIDSHVTECINRLWWIQPSHLEIPESNAGWGRLSIAQSDIYRIDSYKPVRDKLICLLTACQTIAEVISETSMSSDAEKKELSNGGIASADDFLPLLIYCIVRSRPVRLHLNIHTARQIFKEFGAILSHMFSRPWSLLYTQMQACSMGFLANNLIGIQWAHRSHLSAKIYFHYTSCVRYCNEPVGETDLIPQGACRYRFLKVRLTDLKITDVPLLLREYQSMAAELLRLKPDIQGLPDEQHQLPKQGHYTSILGPVVKLLRAQSEGNKKESH